MCYNIIYHDKIQHSSNTSINNSNNNMIMNSIDINININCVIIMILIQIQLLAWYNEVWYDMVWYGMIWLPCTPSQPSAPKHTTVQNNTFEYVCVTFDCFVLRFVVVGCWVALFWVVLLCFALFLTVFGLRGVVFDCCLKSVMPFSDMFGCLVLFCIVVC